MARSTAKSDNVIPLDAAKAESPKPALAKPKIAKPRAAKPKLAAPKAAKPRATKSEAVKSEITKPKAAKPKRAKITAPEIVEAKIAEPKIVQPKIAKPKRKAAAKPKRAAPSQKPIGRKEATFDIEAAKLPAAIADAALRSGGFPYGKRLKRKRYEREMEPLQIELQKLLRWVRDSGERIVIAFDGRDGAGKGGNIKRFTQHLNPRQARVVALPKPSEVERGQWYFQRYAAQMPAAGEIVFFDRSWYNRAGVERVLGFATPAQVEQFLHEAPAFEGMLVRDGVRVIKFFLTIGREMQISRLHARWHDPLKRWKLSPIDFEALPRFDAYSQAFAAMLSTGPSSPAPWTVVHANDKLRARLNAIRHVLHAIPYADKDEAAIGPVDGKIVLGAETYLADRGD